MKPTPEQEKVIDLAATGKSFKVEAYAGCGKTSTLVNAAKVMRGKGLYLAFNRANAMEAKQKFKGYADAATIHSLAYQAVGVQFKDRIEGDDAGKLSPYRMTQVYSYAQLGPITPLGRATLIRQTLDNWMNSADEQPEAVHVPVEQAMLAAEAAGQVLSRAGMLTEVIVRDTRQLVNDLLSGEKPLAMPLDLCLKLYVMSKPKLPGDYILFDEAQDGNDLMMQLIRSQDCQTIYVGDGYQSIYGFRGAVNILSKLDDLPTCHLSQSFRFGTTIADKANVVLDCLGATVPLKGFDTDRSELGSRTALLFRSNTSIFTTLLEKVLKEKQKVAVVGGTKEMGLVLKAVEMLRDGQETTHPDFVAFRSWREYVDASEIPGAPADMKRLVKVCTRNPVRALRYALNITDRVKEEDADLVVSTAHKSKGREWPYVQLAEDFYKPEPGEPLEEEEARLNYVALTRAQIDMVGGEEMLGAFEFRRQEENAHQVTPQEVDALIHQLRGMPTEQRTKYVNGLAPALKQKLMERASSSKATT